eukprot:1413140-Heterocapsa_arctica.AAC.1
MGMWTTMLPGPKGGELWRHPPSTASSSSTRGPEGNTRIDFMICNSSKDITTCWLVGKEDPLPSVPDTSLLPLEGASSS